MTQKRNKDTDELSASFWDHLDILRSVIIRVLLITVAAAVVAFGFKDTLFQVVLAPHSSDFISFRFLGGEPFSVQLMNVDLTEQFMMHMKTAIYVGLLVAAPYILYAVFQFVSPALYENERRYAGSIVTSGYVMFMVGTALNYFLIFPLTVRFLGTYNVSPDVTNMLSVRSYIDTLLTMNLLMGVIFELPVVCWILGRMGIITARFMSEYRRHAIIIIMIVAAIITPTTDIFTLMVVSLPIWLLYEFSILLVKITHAKKRKENPEDDNPNDDPDEDNPDDGPDNTPEDEAQKSSNPHPSASKSDEPSVHSDPDEAEPVETLKSQEEDSSEVIETVDSSAPSESSETSTNSASSESTEISEPSKPAVDYGDIPEWDWEARRLREWGYRG